MSEFFSFLRQDVFFKIWMFFFLTSRIFSPFYHEDKFDLIKKVFSQETNKRNETMEINITINYGQLEQT